jgi:hypothetical protein
VAPRPTLSFCITTRGPADRARALIELIRPHVDEVVLAVDRNDGQETLEACADLADRRLVYELERSPVWLVGWILHQCSCDWILRLDDDEVPSRDLLDALPELVADRYPTVIQIDRRWLYETPDRYITTFPWSLEHQPRLLRNVPSLWRFEGRVHMSGQWLGEVRTSELAMYHLLLLSSSIDDRRAKREWYESLVPGLAVEEFPIEDMYVPEELEQVKTAPVPEPDRPLIDSLLEPKPVAPGTDAGAPVEEATLEQIRLYNTDRPVSEGAYSARIEFIAPRPELPPGVLRHFEVRVENLGDELWRPADGRPPEIHLAWRWRDLKADRPLREEGRVPFTETVLPGRRTRLPILVRTPAVPGPYALELDVVHEHVRWFGCKAEVPVMIDPAAATADAGRPASEARTAWEGVVEERRRLAQEREALAGSNSSPPLRQRVRDGAARLRRLARNRAG